MITYEQEVICSRPAGANSQLGQKSRIVLAKPTLEAISLVFMSIFKIKIGGKRKIITWRHTSLLIVICIYRLLQTRSA